MKEQAYSVLLIVAIVVIMLIVLRPSFSGEPNNPPNVATNNAQKANQQKEAGWLTYLFGPLIVGCVVLLGQSVIAPRVARGVKREESILEQRYKACDSAVNILQRILASSKMRGEPIPEWYVPPEKNPPTQVERNTAYILLAIYGKSDELAEQFYAVSGAKQMKPSDIFHFVSAVRKELGVDKKGYTGNKMHYILNHPSSENGQTDTEAKDVQTQ
jgi:hypothetical protein